MAITRPQPGQGPIAFSGQIVAYDHNSTYTEKEIIGTDTRKITVSNPNPTTDHLYDNLATGAIPMRATQSANGTIQFVRVGTGTSPQQYQNQNVQ